MHQLLVAEIPIRQLSERKAVAVLKVKKETSKEAFRKQEGRKLTTREKKKVLQ